MTFKHRNLRLFARVIMAVSCAVLFSGLFASGSEQTSEDPEALMQHAATYYRLGMTENGTMRAFSKAEEYLEKAKESFKSEQTQDRKDYRLEVNALKSDIEEQKEIAHDTLYGVFPLTRLYVPTLFQDAKATKTYEMVDEPEVIAVFLAAMRFCDKVLKKWSKQPHFHVVFSSTPRAPALENEALYVFDHYERFLGHSHLEVADVLNEEQLRAFERGRFDARMANYVMKAFDIQRILFVNIVEEDRVEGIRHYLLEANVFRRNEQEPAFALATRGLCRDLRGVFIPLLGTNGLLFLVAVGVFICLTFLTGRGKGILKTSASDGGSLPVYKSPMFWLLPVFGFALGRIAPWVFIPLLNSFQPIPETLAKLSFWWPCALGALLFVGPVVLYKAIGFRLKNLPFFNLADRFAPAVLVTVAVGVSAYFAGPLFLYVGSAGQAALPLTALLVGASGCAYLLGYVLHRTKEVRTCWGVWAVVCAVVLGVAVSMAHTGFICAVGAASLAGVVLPFCRRAQQTGEHKGEEISEESPTTVEGLVRASRRPAFQKPVGFEEWKEMVGKALQEDGNQWFVFTGEVGVGKTRAVSEIMLNLRNSSDRDVRVLRGNCPAPLAETTSGSGKTSNSERAQAITPYAPLKEACAPFMNVNMLQEPDGESADMEQLVGKGVDFVPFSDLFLPAVDEGNTSPEVNEEAKNERYEAFVRNLQALTGKNGHLILFLDDIQWLDKASNELLGYLYQNQNNVSRITVILCGHDLGAVNSVVKPHKFKVADRLESLNGPEEKQEGVDATFFDNILGNSLALDRDVAQKIIREVGQGAPGRGRLYWLLGIVEHLARNEYFVWDNTLQRFVWCDEKYQKGYPLPCPNDLSEALEEQLAAFPDYHYVLESAACQGDEVRVSVLAECLGKDRLETVRLLDDIEEQTGILVDYRDNDDVYSFRSPYMLNKLRAIKRLEGKGPSNTDVPQRVREQHACVAGVLEKTLSDSMENIYEVARQYYAAGPRFAQKGMEYCLWAARSARGSGINPKTYKDMAEECAKVVGRKEELDVRIACFEAHATGEKESREDARERIGNLLRGMPDPPTDLLILAARTAYDTIEFANGAAYGETQFWAEQALEEAKEENDVFAEAEALQFIGLSLDPKRFSEKRLEYLRSSMKQIKPVRKQSIQAKALYARIANALAEQLSNTGPACFQEAERLFFQSKAIKESAALRDTKGLAMTHGGLGRLYRKMAFNSGEEEKGSELLQKAVYHLKEDARLCEKVHDVGGQIKMYSFLGRCEMQRNRLVSQSEDDPGAIDYLNSSLELAQKESKPVDMFFAAMGLLQCYQRTQDNEQFNELGRRMVSWAGQLDDQGQPQGVPDDCQEDLSKVLQKSGEGIGEWVYTLQKYIRQPDKKEG